jgi:3-dehydroquinate synthase
VVTREIDLPAYRVTVASGLLEAAGTRLLSEMPAHRYAIITDTNVGPHYAERLVRQLTGRRADVFVVPAGEAHKTRDTWATLTDQLLSAGLGRDGAIIALGGGVIGDLAGFVAATYLRGIRFAQVPTTLLAMIDASIGGKTGVDTAHGKNFVGAFHQPSAVLVDPGTLATLPAAHLRAGLAEAIKHAVIADADYFDRIDANLDVLLADQGWGSPAMATLIARSIEIKADVVRRDEREEGLRKVLNFGHTLGHAIESLSGYTLLHGEAVAIGMALESELAERMGFARRGTSRRVRELLRGAGLPRSRPPNIEPKHILEATRSDKKARAGAVEYALPERIGAMAGAAVGWSMPVPDDVVADVLD